MCQEHVIMIKKESLKDRTMRSMSFGCNNIHVKSGVEVKAMMIGMTRENLRMSDSWLREWSPCISISLFLSPFLFPFLSPCLSLFSFLFCLLMSLYFSLYFSLSSCLFFFSTSFSWCIFSLNIYTDE